MSSNLNLNKAAAAVLCAGLIALLTGKVTEVLYDGGLHHAGKHEEGPRGYKIDVADNAGGDAGGDAAPAGPGDLTPLFATADVAAGEKFVETKCTTCHDVSKGGGNKIGPHIWGVFNRPAASIADFSYSAGMKARAGKKWDFDALNHFLYSPPKFVPGTMMSFAGIPKDQDRANVVAYLATKMTDTPTALPKASAAKPAAGAKDAKAAAAKDAKSAANPAGAATAKAGKSGAAAPATPGTESKPASPKPSSEGEGAQQ